MDTLYPSFHKEIIFVGYEEPPGEGALRASVVRKEWPCMATAHRMECNSLSSLRSLFHPPRKRGNKFPRFSCVKGIRERRDYFNPALRHDP